jgi:hypothetical protein
LSSKIHKITELGLWLELNGLEKDWLLKKTGLPLSIIMRVLYDESFKPSGSIKRKVFSPVKNKDSTVKLSDFWVE